LQLINPSTSPNELNTTLTPHSIIHGDACFAYFNKIWGIPGASNCNIVVRRMPELAKLSQKEIDAEAFVAPMSEAEWKELLGDKFPDFKIRESRLTKVDNQPAQFAVNEMSYTTVAASVYGVQMQFFTMTPGLFWNFVCGSGGQNLRTADLTFQKMRPTFTAILSSFVFER